MYTLGFEGDMARVKTPYWDDLMKLQRESGLSDDVWHFKNFTRCYVRIGKVMRAQGWLVAFATIKHNKERTTRRFMPD